MTIDVRQYGATGDGETLDSAAFSDAIQTCLEEGGGTVLVPAGEYRIEPLQLCSNLRLHLEPGATLRVMNDPGVFPVVRTRWAGYVCHALQPCVFGDGVENVSITGQGVIDGQGSWWWDKYRAIQSGELDGVPDNVQHKLKELNRDVDTSGAKWDEWEQQFLRPVLIQMKACNRVLLDGITLRNSPFWNTQILFSEDVTVNNVRFQNPEGAPNGDGLDIDSSRRVRVSNCSFDVNDDCLCLKSGIDANGREVGRPTEDVTITNCTMYRGHGGVVMGSDTAAGVRNVAISNCVFHGTDRGIRIKSRRGRGGCVEDVHVDNVIMDDVDCPIVMNLYYTCGTTEDRVDYVSDPEPHPVDERTPSIRRINIANTTARGARIAAGTLIGLPESPLEDITLNNVSIMTEKTENAQKAAMSFQCDATSGSGFVLRNHDKVTFRDVSIRAKDGPAIILDDDEGVSMKGCELLPEDTGEKVEIKDE